MRDTDLMQLALSLVPPWQVKACAFDADRRRLDIEIDFARGGRFPCPACGKPDCPVHDTARQEWRHLDFFQHQAFLTARTPRVTCPDCGVKQIAVPWARPGSGFTLLFEALAMTLMTAMPVAAAARLMGEHDTRMWRILHHWVEKARERADHSSVKRVAIDETAARRGHDYITLFVDIDRRCVLYVADGRDAGTVAQFADDLEAHNGDAARIKQVCIVRYERRLHQGRHRQPHRGRDHLRQVPRRQARQRRPRQGAPRREQGAAGAQEEPLSLAQERAQSLRRAGRPALLAASTNLKTARAWRLRLAFQEVYAQPSRAWGELFLDRWYSWARRCRLEPMKQVALTIDRHRDGILRWFNSTIANGLIEGINSLVQAAKAKARGYRSTRTLKAITYLIAGKLDLRR